MPELVWPLREQGDQRARRESGRRGGGDAAPLGPGAGRAGETRETCRGRAGHPAAGIGEPSAGFAPPCPVPDIGINPSNRSIASPGLSQSPGDLGGCSGAVTQPPVGSPGVET